MTTVELSIIIPVYNEEEGIDELYRRLTESLVKMGRTYELVFVDDGSRDRSLEKVTALWERDPAHVKVLSFTRNFGHHLALTAGLDHSTGNIIVMMDSDLQDQPEEMHKLIEKLEAGYDVVWADRVERQHSWYKSLSSKIFVRTLNRVAKTEIPFNTSIYRAMRREVAEDLRRLREQARFLPGLVSWLGYRQTSAPVEHGKRFAGTTKYPFWRLIKLAVHTATSFSSAPLQVATVGGMVTAVIAFLFLVYIVVRKLLGGYGVVGYASTMFAIMFFGALQLIVLGLMGEYISRIYSEAQRRPLYLLRDLHLEERRPNKQTSPRLEISRLIELSGNELDEIHSKLSDDTFLQMRNVPFGASQASIVDLYLEQWRELNPWVIRGLDGGNLRSLAVIQDLQWDTKLLGISAGRLLHANSYTPRFSQKRLDDMDSLLSTTGRFLTDQRLKLVDARVSSQDYFTVRTFERNDFHLVDTLITLGATPEKRDRILEAHLSKQNISAEGIQMSPKVLIRPMREEDREFLAELSFEAFGEVEMIQDRFFLEPSIDHGRSQNLFREWFANIARKQADGTGLVIVAELDGVASGYVAMESMPHPAMNGWWKDSLNAVSPRMRGTGAYRAMIIASLHYLRERGHNGLLTRTQVSTSRVINSWTHMGADIYESFATMHWTGSPIAGNSEQLNNPVLNRIHSQL